MRLVALVVAVILVAACSEHGAAPLQADTCGLKTRQLGSFVQIPGGTFNFGAMPMYPEEGPPQAIDVSAFELMAHEVTNLQFAAFVDATGYVTDAERSVKNDRAGAGSAVFGPTPNNRSANWRIDRTATWRTPEGAGSDIAGRETHPVVHVSKNDAQAYASWAGARLPSEVEIELAMTVGLPDSSNPDSGAYDQAGRPRANTWQGIFPTINTGGDGFAGAAPVGCFGPDELGAYDLIGNVWEWTSTPYGPGQHTIKGGSFLCAANFCKRYRPAARQPQDSDFSSNHTGFRIARDIIESN